jgi:uncharacterized protein
MESAIYTGKLRHRRFQPRGHEFSYDVFMAFLDIDRLPELMNVSPFSAYNRRNLAAFHERDHFGDPSMSLRERLRADATASGIELPDGPIYLLTNLRYVGYNFNPVSFFYCYDSDGNVQTILAEVNSTFGETRNYWLHAAIQARTTNSMQYRVSKTMHVSPFMKMDLDYTFTFTVPGDDLVAHMQTLDDGKCFFDATLSLRREDWSAKSLHSALVRYPFMTAKVIGAIHWQALRLYMKGCPVFTKPACAAAAFRTARTEGGHSASVDHS